MSPRRPSDPAERESCPGAVTGRRPAGVRDGMAADALAGFEPERKLQAGRLSPVPSAAVALGKAPEMGVWIPEDATWIARASKAVWKGRRSAGDPGRAYPGRRRHDSRSRYRPSEASRRCSTPAALGPLVRETNSFADFGDESAGTLRIALPDPGASAAGALGFAALTQAATGQAADRRPCLRESHRRGPHHDQDRAPGRGAGQRRRCGSRRARSDEERQGQRRGDHRAGRAGP